MLGQEYRGKAAKAGVPELTKQVQYLVVFKENLFLPKRIDYVMQLQKDVTLQLSKVNEKQMINMVYSLAPRSLLFIVTKRQLPYGKAYLMKKIKQSVDRLKEHDAEAAKRSGSRKKEE